MAPQELMNLRTEIEAFLHDYQLILDEQRYHDWYALFAPEGSYSVTNVENARDQGMFLVRDDGTEALKERVGWLNGYWQVAPLKAFRTLSNLQIIGHGAEGVRCRSKFVMYRTTLEGTTEFVVCGQYHDHIVETESGWRIQSHDVVVENGIIPTGVIDIL